MMKIFINGPISIFLEGHSLALRGLPTSMEMSTSLEVRSVQYTKILYGCKNGNLQMKRCDFFSAQNIDRGNTLEPPY